jgi:16S rRNA (guanine527-N7)-methyltransferase
MDEDMLLLNRNARSLEIELDADKLAKFDAYKNELLQWNARTNLISENSSKEIISRHFLDSLTALRFIKKTDARIIDAGSGAGFPGIPLKIVRPSLRLYLLESNRRKVSFLKNIIRLLNLDSTDVIHDRAENIMKTDLWKENFDVLISRAAFKLPELILLGEYFLVPGGELIALKGPRAGQEMKLGPPAGNQGKISQLIQHDVAAAFLAAPLKIICGKKKK